MSDEHRPHPVRRGRLHWATLAFLLGFTALLVVVGYFYLVPGAEALREAGSEIQRQHLRAYSVLLLAVLLVLLFVLMLIVFRVRRFFLEEHSRTRTDYPDIWTESARRVHVEEDDEK